MTGIIVLIAVLVLLTTRTRRGRRRWRKALGGCWLLVCWLAAIASPQPSVTPRRASVPSTRPQARVARSRVSRKSPWPAAPWAPRHYSPSDERPGQGPRYFSPLQKQTLLQLAGYQCQHVNAFGIRCHRRDELRADHRHPYSWGGKTIMENGQILCDPHNVEKGAHWTDVHDPAELERVCVAHMLPRNRFGSRRSRRRLVRS